MACFSLRSMLRFLDRNHSLILETTCIYLFHTLKQTTKMHFKLVSLALVALLGVQAYAQLTAADISKDIEMVHEVYDESIDYLTSHGPDSVDYYSVSPFLYVSNLHRKAN